MRRRLALLWGLLMAVTAIGTAPKVVLAVPDIRLTPDKILPLGTAPSGGSASDGTTATQTDFEVEVTPAAANMRDAGGYPFSELYAAGTPSAVLDLTADVSVPGVLGIDASYLIADEDGKIFGASEPYVLGVPETVIAATGGNGYQQPSVTATPDGYLHAAYQNHTSGNGILGYRHRPPSTELWGTVRAPWAGANPSQAMGSGGYIGDPTIWWVRTNDDPGYRIFVAAWFATSTSSQVLRISQSPDRGVTWSTYDSDLVLSFSGTLAYTQMSIEWDYLGEQLVLTLKRNSGGTLTGLTYVANDPSGQHWETLPGSDVSNMEQQATAQLCGVTYRATMVTGSTAVTITRREATTLGWETLTTDTGADFDAAYGLVLVASDAGRLYLIGRSNADEDEVLMQVSVNGGRTWGDPSGTYPYQDGAGLIVIDDDGDAGTTTLADGALLHDGVWVGETLWVIVGLLDSASSVDNSVMILPFGGISNITQDGVPSGSDAPWYPCAVPSTKSADYALQTSGSSTIALAADSLGRLVATISNDASSGSVVYSYPSNPVAVGGIAVLGKDSEATTELVGVAVTAQDGAADHYTAVVYVDGNAGTVRGWDVGSSAYISSAAAYDVTEDLHILIAADGDTGKASAYYRQPGDIGWTALFVNQTVTVIAGGATSTLNVGKLASSATEVDILAIIPFGSSASEFVADLVAGLTASTLVPIRATVEPQWVPWGLSLWWQGTLHDGDSHAISTIARRPLSLTSPRCASPSPTRHWAGSAGASGATYRVVYDLGSGDESRSAHGLAFVGWANLGPASAVRYRRWDGAAWVTDISVAGFTRPFGADGAVGFARDSGNSLTITPNAANGTPAYIRRHDLVNRWVRISDGTNTVIGEVEEVPGLGQFSNATGILQTCFRLKRSTLLTAAGSLGALSTATTTGSIHVYLDDGIGIGVMSIDAVRYIALEWDLPSGATTPKAGLLTCGPAYLLEQRERDGSSMRRVAVSDIRQLPSTGITQGQKVRRRRQRVFELPFDSVPVQPGMYAAGTAVNTIGITSTPRGTISANIDVCESVHDVLDQDIPLGIVIGASFSDDPGTANAVFGNEQVAWVTLPKEIDRVAGQGLLRDLGSHAQHGMQIAVAELI